MARLSKKALFAKFEEAVQLSDWSLRYHGGRTRHPAHYSVWHQDERYRVKVYIWNISFGGRKSLPNEYRIQVTGVTRFKRDPKTRNLVLGWWDDVGVFAGWDIRQHSGPLGSSPSLQINEAALRKALLSGFAPSIKSSGETAIGFRPDFMGTYIENLESLHDSGKIPRELKILTHISDDPDAVHEDEIEKEVAEKRRRALVSTWKAVRANDFSRRVLTAYSHQCAMCGVQLRLIEGAHVVPVGEKGSTDRTSNGIALCALHHKAYDQALVTFDKEFKTHVNEKMVGVLTRENKIAGLPKFRSALRPILITPPAKSDRPHPKYVGQANKLRGWKLS